MLFTYIVNFRGGTFISQVEAESLKDSVIAWLTAISNEPQKIEHIGPKCRAELHDQLVKDYEDNKPLPLIGLKNVWCASFNIKTGFGLVNIIQTERIID